MSESYHAGPTTFDGSRSALRVALAGNPNVGKSTLFNHLTGGNQHVGNWPGKTVERRSGVCRRGAQPMTIVDLPGTYSLASSSPEELVAESALVGDEVDAVAVVVDSTNLERNLYLAAQVAELGRPMVLVLNMSDVAAADRVTIDDRLLSQAFTAPVVRTAGRSGEGLDRLLEALTELDRCRDSLGGNGSTGHGGPLGGLGIDIDYGEPIESELRELGVKVATLDLPPTVSSRWVAIKLLEGDATASASLASAGERALEIIADAGEAARRVSAATGEEPGLLVADHRFDWAHRLAGTAVERENPQRSRTERIDDLLTNRWLGIPIFLGLMWVVFTLVTDVAGPFADWIGDVMAGPIAAVVSAASSAVGLADTWVEDLFIEGVVGGVGSVLVFVPVLAVLYLALGVLEDSGYMARAAFLLDCLMRPIGLTGRSFLPLLLGFGCNVPGVYATRVLESHRGRVVTSLLVPFVTCAARLPVYVLMAAVFFPGARGTVVFVMYIASIAAALLIGGVLDRVVMRGERSDSFILELPPYRKPSTIILWRYTAYRIRAFLARAGTVIFTCSLVVWFLLAIPMSGSGTFADTEMEDSAFGSMAGAVAPVLAPAGLDSWQVAGTLASGFVAKEVVVSTMVQSYGGSADDEGADGGIGAEIVESAKGFLVAARDAVLAIPSVVGLDLAGDEEADDPGIGAAVRADFDQTSGGHGAAAAAAFLAIILLYVPCVATVAAIRAEIGGRWALTSVGLNLTVAWLAAVVVFQLGAALGVG